MMEPAGAARMLTLLPTTAPHGTHHFSHISSLVPEDQDLVGIDARAPISEALEVMQTRGFDQLPVFASNNYIGSFTHRSLARLTSEMKKLDSLMSMRVENSLDEFELLPSTTEIARGIPYLQEHGAILIGADDRPNAIVTSSDLAMFLWRTTEPFILIRDIELAIRYLMLRACEGEAALATALQVALNQKKVSVEDLTYDEYMTVLHNQKLFGKYFRRTFGQSIPLAVNNLKPAGVVRNKVMHFRGEVTEGDVAAIHKARRWLRRKVVTVK